MEEIAGSDVVLLWGRGQVHPCRSVCESTDESVSGEYDVGGEEFEFAAKFGYIGRWVGGGV